MGTETDPYRIANVADWQELVASPIDFDKHFIVVANIDFGGNSIPPRRSLAAFQWRFVTVVVMYFARDDYSS